MSDKSDKEKEDFDKFFDDLFKVDKKNKKEEDNTKEDEPPIFDDDFLNELFGKKDDQPQKVVNEPKLENQPLSDDDFLNDLFGKKDGEQEDDKKDDSSADQKEDKKDDDNFDWLKDLIDTIDKEEQEKKKNAQTAAPAPIVAPPPAPPKSGKPSFLSKIKDRPRPPAPPAHVREYGSGKKIVHMPSQNDYYTSETQSFFKTHRLHLMILSAMYCVLIISGWFVFKGFIGVDSSTPVQTSVVMQNIYSGDKILIDTKEVSQTGRKVVERGYVDSHISNLMYRLLKPGETAVDVGAGFGYYTLYLSRIVGNAGKVYAVEARKNVAELLEASTRINKMQNVKVFNDLVFSHKSNVVIDTSDSQKRSNFGTSSIILENDNAYLNSESKDRLQSSTLDHLLTGVKNVSLLHINTHGSELNILLGAKRILAESPRIKIITTWSKYNMARYINIQDAVSQMMDNGFRFWFIKPSSGNLVELTRLEHIMQVENGRFLIAKTLN